MTVAAAGSRASISANVARGSRAMASWSVTYGITEEQRPTPAPHSSQAGWLNADSAPASPNGVAAIMARSMATASWSMPVSAGPARPVGSAGPSLAIRCPRTT